MIHRFVDLLAEATYIPYVGTGGGNNYVGVLTLDPGQDPTAISTPTANSVIGPVISPDQSLIAYTQAGSIYTIEPSGANETKIWDATTAGYGVDSLDWSKDSQKILFSTVGGAVQHKLYTINRDGTSETELYADPSTRNVAGPSYNHDGTLIGFQVLLSATSIGIWVMDADGTNAAQVVTTPTQLSQIFFDLPIYAWANASDMFAYGGGTLAAPTMRKINADGTGDTLLGSTIVGQGRPLWKRWLPDDSAVLYLADSRTDLRKFAADGSGDSLVRADTVNHKNPIFVFGGRIYMAQNAGLGADDLESMLTDGSDYRVETSSTSDSHSLL